MDRQDTTPSAESPADVDYLLTTSTGLPYKADTETMRRRLVSLKEKNQLFGQPNGTRPPTCPPQRNRTRLVPRTGILRTPEVEERIREYCSEETWRQGYDTRTAAGARAVYRLVYAWRDAERQYRRDGNRITPGLIIKTAVTIEPEANRTGVRRAPVVIGGDIRAQNLSSLHRGLKILCEFGSDRVTGNPVEAMIWYWSFEKVHPFADGNGRTGKVMLNLLLDTMAEPVFPPQTLWGNPILNP